MRSLSTRLFVCGLAALLLGASCMVAQAAAKHTAPTEAEVKAAKAAGTVKVLISTVKGDMTVELYGKDAPLTVANFVKLIKAKYYDGLTFHRVESDPAFTLIQGGDPHGDGSGGPGYTIKLEISKKLRHVKGALAMARTQDPDSAGSQFYICRDSIPMLDDKYAVFGKVIKGLEAANKIQVGDKIKKVTMITAKTKKAKKA